MVEDRDFLVHMTIRLRTGVAFAPMERDRASLERELDIT